MYSISSQDASPMNDEVSELFFKLCIMEHDSKNSPVDPATLADLLKDETLPFPIAVVLKRIDVLKLPIKLTMAALLTFAILTDRVGAVVVMLIDLLENFAGREGVVTIEDIANTYPMGFYNEKAFIRRAEAFKADREKPEGERQYKYSYVY